jgi:tetratricopeptide (TPR) repeat protein
MKDLRAIRKAFLRAIDTPPSELEQMLGELDAATREEVVALLEARGPSAGFLAPSGEEEVAPAGESIGAYTVMEKVGAGGMGVVYRARRTDGAFDRDVAIKFIDGRMFGPEADRRFLAERRILALLDHPNIVRLLDGGIWRGRRYLMLEWLNGKPVNEYCRDAGLDIAAKLRLFRTICSAVQFAHQHLVLHRDLKASNILVTADGQVKILDFGIARLVTGIEGISVETTMLNPMSLSCASPEQVRGDRLTLASDIYALGLLLHELLCGVNPQANDSPSAIRHLIESGELPAPSRKDPSISSDLDAIAMKATAFEPERRYGSALELATDVSLFLDGRPVSARTPSWLDLTSRFVRRNRALAASLVALALAIAGGSAASLWELRRAELQRALAERRFADARQMVNMVIQDIQPQMAEINGTVALRAQLLEKSLLYLEALQRDAGDNPPLMRDMIDGYVQLAAVSGDVAHPNIGDHRRSGDLLAKAATLADDLERRPEKSNPAVAKSLVALYCARTRQYAADGEVENAVRSARHAVILAEGASDTDAGMAANTLADVVPGAEKIELYKKAIAIWKKESRNKSMAIAFRNLSTAWNDQHDYPKAIEAGREALRLDEAAAQQQPGSPVEKLAIAFDLGTMGTAFASMGQYVEAADHWRRSLELRDAVLATNPQDRRAADRVGYALTELGRSEQRAGNRAAARTHLLRAVDVYARLTQISVLNRQSVVQYATACYSLALLANECDWYERADQIALGYEQRMGPPPDPNAAENFARIHAGAQACTLRTKR